VVVMKRMNDAAAYEGQTRNVVMGASGKQLRTQLG
jgi:hypothetical protein